MTTRRQLIQSIPALPLITTAGAAALLAGCGKKNESLSTSSASGSGSGSGSSSTAPATSGSTDAAPAGNSSVAGSSGGSGSAGVSAGSANVASGSLLDEKDPQAVALGYVAVAAKADKVKFPKYESGQACSNCALYLGGAAEQGGCPLFPGKQVLSKAWCSGWVKKAA